MVYETLQLKIFVFSGLLSHRHILFGNLSAERTRQLPKCRPEWHEFDRTMHESRTLKHRTCAHGKIRFRPILCM